MVMDRQIRIAIVDHAVRWTNNILVEVQNNHGKALGPRKLAALRVIVTAIGEYVAEGKEEPSG
jgi:hypothetical protein